VREQGKGCANAAIGKGFFRPENLSGNPVPGKDRAFRACWGTKKAGAGDLATRKAAGGEPSTSGDPVGVVALGEERSADKDEAWGEGGFRVPVQRRPDA